MAASLDSHFVLAPSLEMYFVNKDTGLPLVNGKIYFFEDQARTVPKSVYQIVSAAPGGPYTYVALPNPVTLSAVGTFQDNNNNDILPYYFPFSGTPDSPGGIELYYIEVYDSLGVLQFTREAWPNLTESDITANQDVTNFVPNGQFLLHNNVPASTANTFIANQISQSSTIIGQGGWSFDRPIGSTAVDSVSFIRYPTTESPTGNPRFAVQIQTTTPAGDAFKDLRLKFPSVNQFASLDIPYNLYFEAEALNGSDINNCQIVIRKFYGSNGSPTTEDIKGTFSLVNGTIKKYNFSIIFGENTGKSIGALDDDYMQVIMRLPGNAAQTAVFTDFCITVNDEKVSTFPTQTNAEQLTESTSGWFPTPDHNGQDLYLPAILTPTGMTFDHSQIGKINAATYNTAFPGELLCDGSQFYTLDYSTDGIPYSRLFNVLFDGGVGASIFGTGSNFVNSYRDSNVNTQLRIHTNKAGAQTAPVDGTTGFNFTLVGGATTSVTGNTSLGYSAGTNGSSTFTAILGGSSNPIFNMSNAGNGLTSGSENTQNDVTGIKYSFVGVTKAAGALVTGGAGLYFQFATAAAKFYIWYNTGTEVDPALGGGFVGIQVKLISTMTATDIASITASAISQFQVDIIGINAASTIAAGSYFNFHSSTLLYTVWYTKDGLGTQPNVPTTSKYIPVAVISTDTATVVSLKTQIAINSTFFSIPDLRGAFLRGTDASGTWDISVASRYNSNNLLISTLTGSFEVNQMASHYHGIPAANSTNASATAAASTITPNLAFASQLTGGTENRPYNMFVNWFIKY